MDKDGKQRAAAQALRAKAVARARQIQADVRRAAKDKGGK